MIALVSASCGSDSPSSDDGGETPTGPAPSNINVSVDPAFVTRTAVAGTTLPAEVHVTQNGSPAAGIGITWSLTKSGGTVEPATSSTDANGVARTSWTLNDTVRTAVLTAAVVGASSGTLTVTSIAGPPATIKKVSPDSIGVVAGASTNVTVRVTDKGGNAIAGSTVTWSATGGALTVTNTTTGSSGNGQVVFSTDAAPKSYTVTATVAGIGAVTFKVVGL
jgi:adhesin/invasin